SAQTFEYFQGGAWESRSELDAVLARFESTTPEALFPVDWMQKAKDAIDAALDRLGAACGGDPIAILHRIDPNTLAAIDSEDAVELDLDGLDADDVREAYRDAMARRAELRKAAAGGLTVQVPVRTYDVDTAIDEFGPGPSRIAAMPGDAARAFLYLS